MSRTDNTDPFWVRAIWWKPDHSGCQYAMFYRGRSCDLPAEPIVAKEYGTHWRARSQGGCNWGPSGEGIAGGMRSVPSRFRRSRFNRIYYTGPQRSRIRNQLARARQEHRGSGQIETEIDTSQHRHQGKWDW